MGVASGLVLVLGINIASASPSQAATRTTFAHKCTLVADDGTTQGVFCVDLFGEFQSGAVGYFVELQVEALCQYDADLPDSVTTRCSNVALPTDSWEIHATNGLFDTSLTDGCGHGQPLHPDCSTGRNYFNFDSVDGRNAPAPIYVPPGSCYNIWGVLFPSASINLPGSNTPGNPAATLSTGHVEISGSGTTCG